MNVVFFCFSRRAVRHIGCHIASNCRACEHGGRSPNHLCRIVRDHRVSDINARIFLSYAAIRLRCRLRRSFCKFEHMNDHICTSCSGTADGFDSGSRSIGSHHIRKLESGPMRMNDQLNHNGTSTEETSTDNIWNRSQGDTVR